MSEQEVEQLTIVAGMVVFFIVIFCIPAIVIRFLVKKEKLTKGAAFTIAAVTWIGYFTVLWLSSSDGVISPLGPTLAAVIVFTICRYEKQRIW